MLPLYNNNHIKHRVHTQLRRAIRAQIYNTLLIVAQLNSGKIWFPNRRPVEHGDSMHRPAGREVGRTSVGISPRGLSPTVAAALASTPLNSRSAVGIAPLGLSPAAAPPSALTDSDRPLFLGNSTIMFLMASIVEAWLSLNSWTSRLRCSTSEGIVLEGELLESKACSLSKVLRKEE